MAAMRGGRLLIRYNAGTADEPIWANLGGLRTRSIRKGRQIIDITTSDTAELARTLLDGGGVFTLSATGEGVFESGAAQEAMSEAADSGELMLLQVIIPGVGQYGGHFQVTDFGLTGNHDDALMFSVSLESAEANALAPMEWAQDAVHAFDFMTNEAIWNGTYAGAISGVPGYSFSRASVGYARDSTGAYTQFASGAMRRTDKGVLIEGSSTNHVRNNSMQGAVTGSPGTLPTNWQVTTTSLTQTVVGVGTQNGIDYIDIRLNGTTGGTVGSVDFETTTGITATNSQAWASSIFLAVVGGSITNVSAIQMLLITRDSGGTLLTSQSGSDIKASLTSTMQRFRYNATTNHASAARVQPRLSLGWSSGVAIDITIRIGWPQMEQAAYSTSPIRTTGSTVTRAADSLTFTISGPGFPLSLYASGERTVDTGVDEVIAQVSDGTTSNRAMLQIGSTDDRPSLRVVSGGADQAAIGVGSAIAVDTTYSIAARIAANDAQASRSGALGLQDTSVTVPAAPTSFRIGSTNSNASPLTGYVRRAALFGAGLTDAQLQALTA